MSDCISTNTKPIVPTQILRENIRNYSRAQREKKREKNADALRFGLEEIQKNIIELHKFTEEDVRALTARIKRRKQASTEDMYRLCHAFLQSENNIIIFANITGATQLIIKELTGKTASHQLCAAECLCNLSLGPNFVSEKIAKMSGSYLVTYLDSTEHELKRTTLWTLANILASNKSTAQIIIQMELVPKLWRLYTADDQNNSIEECLDFRYDAGQCLQLLSLQTKSILRQEDKDFICKNLHLKNANSNKASEFYLQIVCHFDIISPNYYILDISALNYLIDFCLINIEKTEYFNSIEQRLKILYAVRVLGNLLTVYEEIAFKLLMEQLSTIWCSDLTTLLNKLFKFNESALRQEIFWLVKNLVKQRKGYDINFLNDLNILKVNNNKNIEIAAAKAITEFTL